MVIALPYPRRILTDGTTVRTTARAEDVDQAALAAVDEMTERAAMLASVANWTMGGGI